MTKCLTTSALLVVGKALGERKRQYPAYRATLLLIKRGGTKSRLVSLFLSESFLTKLISN
jgi:hypothetical protein